MSAKRRPAEVGTTSASGRATIKDSWKLTLPCTRAEAEAIGTADDVDIDPPPVLLTSEEADDPLRWRLDVYFEREPGAHEIAAVRKLVAGAGEPRIERLGDEDWVTLSQAGLEPVRAGRFVVHTAAHPADPPPGGRAFMIEASQAFGTGHHETTAGCLEMLDALAGESFANVIDLGTGTGLLAFAARHLWPEAEVTATDIDPISIAVTLDNMAANATDRVRLVVADGTSDPAIAAGAPYDLIVANILAQPLIALAPDIAAIADTPSRLVLAGLLTTQADAVASAYEAQGYAIAPRDERGDWTILGLRKG